MLTPGVIYLTNVVEVPPARGEVFGFPSRTYVEWQQGNVIETQKMKLVHPSEGTRDESGGRWQE